MGRVSVAAEKLRTRLAGLGAEDKLDYVGTMPSDVDDVDWLAEADAPDGTAGLQVFESGHEAGG